MKIQHANICMRFSDQFLGQRLVSCRSFPSASFLCLIEKHQSCSSSGFWWTMGIIAGCAMIAEDFGYVQLTDRTTACVVTTDLLVDTGCLASVALLRHVEAIEKEQEIRVTWLNWKSSICLTRKQEDFQRKSVLHTTPRFFTATVNFR